ncbi:MAG: hypothetical protein DCC48_04290 [Acidobacteria bacterium]|nr:MAG: hypothetical protein DCC48_04290 [Acidobacteriota bacterium]
MAERGSRKGSGAEGPPGGPPKQYYVPAPERPPVESRARPSPPRQKVAPPAPPKVPPAPRTKKKPRTRRWVLIGLGTLVVLVMVFAGFMLWKFFSIERLDLSDALSTSGNGGTNYLIVGSDSREGVAADDPNAGAFGEVSGQRADTMIVLRVEPDRSLMMSIPRDLYVTLAGSGQEERINAAYNDGPASLVDTVEQNLGVPVNHYLEVDFESFGGMVDAVGGVPIDFEYPAYDSNSGLQVDSAGTVVLDGTQALAYVRSRHYTEIIDGQPTTDPTGDLGRVERQQAFMRTVLAEMGRTRNPIALMRIGSALAGGVRIDGQLGLWDAFGLARRLGALDPQTVVLPTEPFTTPGGAQVLSLQEPAADAVLAEMGRA